ncbi:recombinase family protein [Enterococcus faecalis]
MKRAGLYIRVSTPEQEKHGYSLEAQKKKLQAYALAKDYTIFKIYTDGGFSGAKLERPALSDMINDIESQKLDLVIVYKLDRLSRSQKNTMYLIEDVFLKNNVDFVSMQESFDTTSSFGRAMIGILSVFSQLERDNITERMTMGKLERVKRGYYMGGGNVPFGYLYDEISGLLEIEEDKAQAIRRMFDLFISGNAITMIVEILKREFPQFKKSFMDSTVKRRLQSEYYIGKQKYQGKVYDAIHQPIISEDLFNKVQRLIESRPHSNAFKHSYLFSGIIVCSKCGKPYNGYESQRKVNGKIYKHKYYRCSCRTYKHKKKYGWSCSGKTFRCEALDKMAMKEIRNFADTVNVRRARRKIDNEPTIKEIKKVKMQQEKLVDLYLSNIITASVLDKKNKELSDLIVQLESKLKREITIEDEKKFEKSLEELAYNFDNLSFSQKRFLIENTVEQIQVDGDEVVVSFIM